jgi:hypothetical protein
VIVNDGFMAVLNETTGNIAAHAAKTDNANLHGKLRSR